MFAIHLAVSLSVSSIMVIIIMFIRKFFKNQLSPKWTYNLWFLLLIALLLPYIPNQLLHFGDTFTWNGKPHGDNPTSSMITTGNNGSTESGNWMHDFSISVSKIDLTFLNNVLFIIWILGALFMVALFMHAWLKLRQIKKSIHLVNDHQMKALFEKCKQQLNISDSIVLGQSPLIKSPLTFGIFKTYIVLPSHVETWLSQDKIRYILLHELHHYKYKDIVTNYLIVIFQIVYWFNPLIWMAFREMRLDREIACDTAVLNTLDQQQHIAYGETILKFADATHLPKQHAMTNQFASPKKQLKKRMEQIVAFTPETKLDKLTSVLIFMLLCGIVVGQIPIVSAMPSGEDRIQFDNNQTVYEDLSTYFDRYEGYEGSFVLYDLQEEQYNIYNKDNSTLRVSPNSTYKIYSALFALESKIITRNENSMKWNGESYPYQDWNQHQNLFTALENSVTWYFQQLDKHIQTENIQSYLDRMRYGNRDLSGGIEDYWLESSLKISPIEQVQTLKNFYTNQYEFDDKNIQFIKDAMKLESKDSATLYGKTGTGTVNERNVNGWFIGYVEANNHVYFFATNIASDDHANGSIAAEITKSILHDKDIY